MKLTETTKETLTVHILNFAFKENWKSTAGSTI